jgi:twitching motility two-component system response regulator PilG
MNQKGQSFAILAVGITEKERMILRSIFRLSAHRPRVYVLTESLASADILIVDKSAKDTVATTAQKQGGGKRAQPMILVTESANPDNAAYSIRRPFVATRLLNALDQIAIKELSGGAELVVGDENSLSTHATKTQQETPTTKRGKDVYVALVVDDSLAVRKLVELELRALNIMGDFAENAGEAFALLRRNTYDIIFLDVVLPQVDGYKMCRVIKKDKNTKNTPIIMLTGKSSTFDRVRGKFAGCDSYLVKPAKSETFRKTIQQYLPIDINADEPGTGRPNREELLPMTEQS